jgi:hypothetical protein
MNDHLGLSYRRKRETGTREQTFDPQSAARSCRLHETSNAQTRGDRGKVGADIVDPHWTPVSLALARPGGFEPPTHSLEGCCSILLS